MFQLPYLAVAILATLGWVLMALHPYALKKLLGLGMFQTSIIVFFLLTGKVIGGRPPILEPYSQTLYANPLPQVLMLTAIVVGAATLGLGLALLLRLQKGYGHLNSEQWDDADDA